MNVKMKNIAQSEVLTLKDEISYQKGQVVSKTLAQNDAVSISLYDTMQHVLIFSDEGQYDAPRLQGQGGGTQYYAVAAAYDKGQHAVAACT